MTNAYPAAVGRPKIVIISPHHTGNSSGDEIVSSERELLLRNYDDIFNELRSAPRKLPHSVK